MFPDETFDAIGEGFDCSIHAFFTKKNESLGSEILDTLDHLSQKHQLKVDVNVVYTREGGQRLSKDRAMELLTSTHQKTPVSKVFVCGPPPQNIMFLELRK